MEILRQKIKADKKLLVAANMDLKKALDTGAMTQQEYEKQRTKILDK